MVMSERHFRYDLVLVDVRRYEGEIQRSLSQILVVQRILVFDTSLKNKPVVVKLPINLKSNKTVLLRERKRHTARRVASTRHAVLAGGGGGGVPTLVGGGTYPGGGGGTYPGGGYLP